jgi:hypothetical protein
MTAAAPEPTAPAPSPRKGGGCLMLGFAILLGVIFAFSVISIPLPLFMPGVGGGEAGRWAIAGLCVLQAAFWGYAARGALRAYRGQGDAHLIPPRLLRPVALVVGVVFSLAGLGGMLAGARGTGRALGFGLALIVFFFAGKKKDAPPA